MYSVCTGLTQQYLLVEYFLHKVQIHVSALDNGHLQVYMKYLLSSYTTHTFVVYVGREGIKWARDLGICQSLGSVGYMRDPCCYQVMSKIIIVKSKVGTILCLRVLCNYTKI